MQAKDLLTPSERIILLNLLRHVDELYAWRGKRFLAEWETLNGVSLDEILQTVEISSFRERLREAAHFCGGLVSSDYSIAHQELTTADIQEFSRIVRIAQQRPEDYNSERPDWFHSWELLHYFADRLRDGDSDQEPPDSAND